MNLSDNITTNMEVLIVIEETTHKYGAKSLQHDIKPIGGINLLNEPEKANHIL